MMMSKEYFFKLFANCIPSVGEEDIYLIDYHTVSYLKIDDYIYDLITKISPSLSISEIKNDSELGDDAVDILNFLVENNFGFLVDDVNQYPDINISFSSPEKINNAIIEVDNYDNYNVPDVISQLNNLSCGKLEIWITNSISLEKMIPLIIDFEDSLIRTIQIIINYNFLSKKDIDCLESLINKNIQSKIELIIYNHLDDKAFDNALFTKENLYNSNYLPLKTNPIHLNLSFYLESKNHNAFLYKKVCIDKMGEVKNFLSFNKSFGNINNSSLESIIETLEFQELWFVNNDKINQIKYSPFRFCFPILDEPIIDNITSLYNIPLSDSYPWDIEVNS